MNDIGFRAHDFGTFTSAQELAKVVSSIKTPSSIQLALGKVIKPSRGWEDWDEEYISSITADLAAYGVSTAVVGCYINPVHPDEDEREKHIRRFIKSLSLTKAFGCRIVGTETGSWTKDISYSAETYTDKVFSVFLNSLEKMLAAAEKHDAVCAIEAVSHHHTILQQLKSMMPCVQ